MSKSWSKTTRYIVLILLLIAVVAFIVAAKDLIVPLAISALLAWLLNPAVTLFNSRTKLKRHWAVLIVYLFSLAIIIAMGVALALLAPSQINHIADDVENIYIVVNEQLVERLSRPVIFLGTELHPQTLFDNLSLDTTALMRPDIVWEWLKAASTNLTWILVIIV